MPDNLLSKNTSGSGQGVAIGRHARSAFQSDHNCAQSLIESFENDPRIKSNSLNSGLGAGLGEGVAGTGCMCGALNGALIVLNAYVAGFNLEKGAAQELANKLTLIAMEEFKQNHGSTCCRVLKRNHKYNSPEWLSHCSDLTEFSTRLVDRIIEDHQAQLGQGVKAKKRSKLDMLHVLKTASQSLLAGLGIAVGLGTIYALFATPGTWWMMIGLIPGIFLAFLNTSTNTSIRLFGRMGYVAAMVGAIIYMAFMMFSQATGPAGALFSAIMTAHIHSIIPLVIAFVALLVLSVLKAVELYRFR